MNIEQSTIMKRLTKKQIETVQKAVIKKNSGEMFLHCKHCLKEYQEDKFGEGQAPKEAMTYALGQTTIEFDKEKYMGIMVVYCNRCGRPTWDSRHLTHLY